MDLVGYVRVSRVAGREGDSFISPDVQRERINASAIAGGHRIVAWEIDLDEPGSRYERPGFQAALEAVERGEAGGIGVASLDRFARSVPDAALALKRLDECGGILISSRDALDTSTPVGRFARTMMLAIAELELERIRENWRTATEAAIARGVHVSRVPPFGYQRGDAGRLVPDPVAAPVLREVFARRARGDSWRALAEYLDEAAPRESGSWPISTLTTMVGRRVYLGEAAAGEIVNREAHPALVTRAEWEAAQPAAVRPAARFSGGLLAGIARCGSCTEPMTTSTAGRSGHRNYVCRRRSAGGLCPAPTRVAMRRFDEYVESVFLTWLAANPIRLEGVPTDSSLEQAVAVVEAAEAELVAYRDADLVSVVGAAVYRDGLRQRASVLDAARQRFADISQRAPAHLLVDLAERWTSLGLQDRAAILGEAIEAVYVFRGDSATGGGRPPIESRVRIDWRPDVAGMQTAQH